MNLLGPQPRPMSEGTASPTAMASRLEGPASAHGATQIHSARSVRRPASCDHAPGLDAAHGAVLAGPTRQNAGAHGARQIGAAAPSRQGNGAVAHERLGIVRDAYGCAVLAAIIASFLQSRVPFYLGAFIFLTDGERIESALATIGIRFGAGSDRARDRQRLRLPVRRVRAARVVAGLRPRLARRLDAAVQFGPTNPRQVSVSRSS